MRKPLTCHWRCLARYQLFASPAERDAECAARHRQDWDEDGDGKDETFACVSDEVETEADCEALFPGGGSEQG